MKVHELIKKLQEMPSNKDVIVWAEDLDDNYDIDFIEEDELNDLEVIINIKQA